MPDTDPREIGVQGLQGLKGLNELPNPNRDFLNSLPDYNSYSGKDMYIQGVANTAPIEYVDTPDNFGESRHDKNIATLSDLKDLNDFRGRDQGALESYGLGLLKAGVLAATTFADGILGTPIQLMETLSYIGEHAGKEDFSWNQAFAAGINNPFSKAMQDINKWSEEAMPIYQTKQEMENMQNGEWYKNIFHSSFIADNLVKNLGFTIGAIYSGKVYAGLATKALALDDARKAFKGLTVVTKEGKQLDNAVDIANAFVKGDAFMSGQALTKELGRQALRLKKADVGLQLFGSFMGALGEGRIEAVSNSEDWVKGYSDKIESQYQEELQRIDAMIANDPQNYSYGMPNPETGQPGTKELTQNAQELKQMMINEATKNKEAKLADIYKKQATFANTDFLLNIPLLTIGDFLQFGKFISGGYRAGKATVPGVIKDVAKGEYKNSTGRFALDLAKAGSKPFLEANEEFQQGAFSKIGGYNALRGLTDYYGRALDPDAQKDVNSLINAFVAGYKDQVSDPNAYMEAYAGFITGLFGVPSFERIKTEDGKSKVKFRLNSEFYEGVKDAFQNKADAKELADQMNKRVKSPEFLNYYQGIIRNKSLEKDIKDAMANDDQNGYQNAKSSQMISDAIMFSKAGRLQDLKDIVEGFTDVTDEQIESIRQNSIDTNTHTSIWDGVSNEEMRERLKSNAEYAMRQIESYEKNSKNLMTLYGNSLEDGVIEEMTWELSQIDDREERAKELHGKIKEILNDKIGEIRERSGVDILDDFDGNFFDALHQSPQLLSDIELIASDHNLTQEQQAEAIMSKIEQAEQDKLKNEREFSDKVDRINKRNANYRDRLKRSKQRLTKEVELLETKKSLENQLAELKRAFESRIQNQKRFSPNRYNALKKRLDVQIAPLLDEIQHVNDVAGVENVEQKILALSGMLKSNVVSDKKTKEGYAETPELQEQRAYNEASEKEKNLLSQIAILYRALDDRLNNDINPIDRAQAKALLSDFAKVYAARKNFIENYMALSENPSLFTKETTRLRNRMRDDATKKKLKEILDKVADIKTTKDLKALLDETPALKKTILKKLKEGDNAKLKNLAKDLERMENVDARIADIINAIEDEELKTNLANHASQTIEDAENYDEFIENFSDVSELDPDTADAVEELLDELGLETSSAATSEDDTTTPATPKKKTPHTVEPEETASNEEESSEGASFFDGMGEEEDEESSKVDDSEESEEKPDPEEEVLIPEETPAEVPSAEPEKVETESTVETEEKEEAESVERVEEVETPESSEEVEESETPSASEAASEVHENPEEKETKPTIPEFSSDGSTVYNGVAESEYEYNPLKEGRAVPRSNSVIRQLRVLGAYHFVDSGRLADMQRKNPDLKIHVVAVDQPGLEGLPVLAVRLNKGDNKPTGAVTIKNGETYQVVGVIREPKDAKGRKEYRAIVRRLAAEAAASTSDFVVSSITMTIAGPIRSGRLVTERAGRPKETKTINRDYYPVGVEPKFAIVFDSSEETSDVDGPVQALNVENPNSRKGTVWMLVKGADGTYYHRQARVRRFTEEEYPEAQYKDGIVYRRIKEALRVIVDPKSTASQVAKAKKALEEVLVIKKSEDGYLMDAPVKTEDTVRSVSIQGGPQNITQDAESIDEAVDAIMTALRDPSLGYRFQVTSEMIKEDIDYILDSEILDTELERPMNANADFSVKVDTGTPITEEKVVTPKPSSRTFDTAKTGLRVTINGASFNKANDGKIYDSEGEEVTDTNKIAEVTLLANAISGLVNPVEGTTSLYTAFYPDGIIFGIQRNKVIKGMDLIDALADARERAEKRKAEERVKKEAEEEVEGTTESTESTGSFFDGMTENGEEDPTTIDIEDDIDAEESRPTPPPSSTSSQPVRIDSSSVGQKFTGNAKVNVMRLTGQNLKYIQEKLGKITLMDFIKKLESSNTVSFDDIKTEEDLKTAVNLIAECR